LLRVNDVHEGAVEEVLPKNRKIIQPPRVFTETVRQKIHQYLESTSNIPENSDPLPNESGSCSSRTAIKSDTLARIPINLPEN
jgi:hypothetical protein